MDSQFHSKRKKLSSKASHLATAVGVHPCGRYSSLFVVIPRYSSLFVAIRRCSSLFVALRRSSSLFVATRRYSDLARIATRAKFLFVLRTRGSLFPLHGSGSHRVAPAEA